MVPFFRPCRSLVLLAAWAAWGLAAAQGTAEGPAVDAAATPAPAPSAFTANLTLTTNYKFRGQDQSQIGRGGYYTGRAIKPAIQGGFDYAFGDSGFYVGNWNSSVHWLPGNRVEMDFYGGYKFKGGPIDWDLGVLTYVYPGNRNGNTTELYAAGSYSDERLGSLTVKYSHTVSRDYFGYAGANSWSAWADPFGTRPSGRNTGYLNIAYSKEVLPKLTFKAALGYTRMSRDIRAAGYASYLDYNVGASYDFGGGLSLAASVQGANKQRAYRLATSPSLDLRGDGSGVLPGGTQSINKPRLVLALTKTF